MKMKLLGVGVVVLLVAGPANALTVTINPNQTVTSTPGAVTFFDFDGIQNTSIGTFIGTSMDTTFPVAAQPDGGRFISAFQPVPANNVTLTFVNPVSYVGFAWGTPDRVNQVDVYNGATLLGSFFGDTSFFPNTYFFNITAGPGEAITRLVETFPPSEAGPCCFETDNYAAIVNPIPLPAALPLFATGLGALGLLGWRRKRKQAV